LVPVPGMDGADRGRRRIPPPPRPAGRVTGSRPGRDPHPVCAFSRPRRHARGLRAGQSLRAGGAAEVLAHDVQAAILTRYVRSAVLDVMREDFIRTARAKGLTRTKALFAHGLRNAAIPVITVAGVQLATLLVGAVIIEQIFVLPGIGSELIRAVANRDLIAVQGIVMVLVLLVLIINLIVDVLVPVVDPRIRNAA